MNKLDFYAFHLMPYPYIPPGEEIESTWVTLLEQPLRPEGRTPPLQRVPRAADRRREARLRRRLRERAPPERLRHDALARTSWRRISPRKTERIPIGIIGNALPLHANPVRVAEEVAMLDVISGGRHHLRLRARHGHGVLLLRRQPELLAGALLGGARPDHQGVDRAGAVRVGGQALPPPLRQPLAAAAAEAASADLAAGLGLARDGAQGGEAPLPVHDGLRAAVVHEDELRHVPEGGRGERLRGRRRSSSRRRSRPTWRRPTSRPIARPSRTSCGSSRTG